MAEVAIVTGGAGGLGSSICAALAEDGIQVVVADFRKDDAEALAAKLKSEGKEALAVGVDVGDKQSVAAMVQSALDAYGQLDHQINFAGLMSRFPIAELAEEEWDRVIRVNLRGVFLCSQAAAAAMRPRKSGRIINVASGRGIAGAPQSAPLRRLQGRRHRLHQIDGRGGRPGQHPRKQHLSGTDGDPHGASRIHGRAMAGHRGDGSHAGRTHPEGRDRRAGPLSGVRRHTLRYRPDVPAADAVTSSLDECVLRLRFATLRTNGWGRALSPTVRPERSEAKSKDAAPGSGSAGLGTQSPIP